MGSGLMAHNRVPAPYPFAAIVTDCSRRVVQRRGTNDAKFPLPHT